jgi:hypothetical protein
MRVTVIAGFLLVAVGGWHAWQRLRSAEAALLDLYLSVTDYNFQAAKAGLPQIGRVGEHGKFVDPADWEVKKSEYLDKLQGK